MITQRIERTPIRIEDQTIELETRWIAREHADAPLIVFLHEGLGSIAIWEDWPDRFCAATGCRGLVYSRYGYGGSTRRPAGEPWPFDYLEREARLALPALFAALNIDSARDKPILFGHSDGASIALLHAAAFPDSVRAMIVAAPHLFVEDIARARIEQVREVYRAGSLRDKLAAQHADPDTVFWGWSDLWLNPEYREWNISTLLSRISCPVLGVQGREDQYGTLEQLYELKRRVPQTELLIIEQCRHVPHQDQPQVVLENGVRFLREVSVAR